MVHREHEHKFYRQTNRRRFVDGGLNERVMNLLFGWLWILLGFITGMVLGMFFHGEGWLGGYGSFKRRMYRLGHISFFGVGVVNVLFSMTMNGVVTSSPLISAASAAFIIGGITMPICCVVMAHFPKAHMIFAIPVISLIFAAGVTVVLIASDMQPPYFQYPK